MVPTLTNWPIPCHIWATRQFDSSLKVSIPVISDCSIISPVCGQAVPFLQCLGSNNHRWVLRTMGLRHAIHFLTIPFSDPPTLSLFRDPLQKLLLLQQLQTLHALEATEKVLLQHWERGSTHISWSPNPRGGVETDIQRPRFLQVQQIYEIPPVHLESQ